MPDRDTPVHHEMEWFFRTPEARGGNTTIELRPANGSFRMACTDWLGCGTRWREGAPALAIVLNAFMVPVKGKKTGIVPSAKL
jgi:hypothetical protein